MKITRLDIDAFKRITALSITPDGHTVVLGGKNGSGKSSTLDAIEAALGGTRHAPEKPIHKGRRKARIVLETEELCVTRTFTTKGSTLTVTAKSGEQKKSPQALLDALVGPISFDPVAFCRLHKREQADMLRSVVGLDTSAIDAEREEAFTARRDAKRELADVTALLEMQPHVAANAPAAPVSVADLVDQLEAANSHNAHIDTVWCRVRALKDERQLAEDKIAEMEEQLKTMRGKAGELDERIDKGSQIHSGLARVDTGEIVEQITQAEAVNAAVADAKKSASLKAEVASMSDRIRSLVGIIEDCDDRKQVAIAAASYPIDGLAVDDDGITLNGMPLEQASSAEQLRVSTAIGLAVNPELRVLLIRDGSLLDDDSLAMVAKMAADHDAQVWIERVSTGDEVSVVIEDGARADEGAA